MLCSLKIENIAVIKKAEISFEKGLNVLTGETGAGKSIIIDSINAILGERTTKELIRDGAQKGRVTAFFEDIPLSVKEKLSEYEIESEEDGSLLISRTISNDGRSISKINGTTVTAAMLKNVGRELISICGQHDSQLLLSTDYHLQLIDAIAENDELKEDYLLTYNKIKDTAKKLRDVKSSSKDIKQRADFLKFQIDELSRAKIIPGEKERLLSEKKKILSKEKFDTALVKASQLLSGDENFSGISSAVFELSKTLGELSEFGEKFNELRTSIEEVEYVFSDCAFEISSFMNDGDYSSGDINEIEERLDVLSRLSSKYGETEEEMLSFLEKAQEEYESIFTSDELIEKYEEEIDFLSDELFKKGCVLSDSRKLTAIELQEKIKKELNFLDMPEASFEVEFLEDKATKNGMDKVQFLFSANKGQAPKPLSKIASGGELSRVMLALRSVLLDLDEISAVIFDEIDSGVSGRAAQKIAYKMHEISCFKQVLCVTHLAQIASFADNHLFIEKTTEEEETFTKVKTLSEDERVREIARIIGGDIITETTLSSARELISFARGEGLDNST